MPLTPSTRTVIVEGLLKNLSQHGEFEHNYIATQLYGIKELRQPARFELNSEGDALLREFEGYCETVPGKVDQNNHAVCRLNALGKACAAIAAARAGARIFMTPRAGNTAAIIPGTAGSTSAIDTRLHPDGTGVLFPYSAQGNRGQRH